METGDVSDAIQCYMNETGASEADSHEHLKCMIHETWKHMNQEAFNSPLSENFKYVVINLTRSALLFYQHGDGYTLPDHKTKNRIQSLIVQSISVIPK